MKRITFPLNVQMKGDEVADLHEALQVLLDRSSILRSDERGRRELSANLKRESAEQSFGETTIQLVSIFQREAGLQITGGVDEATATALNRIFDADAIPIVVDNVVVQENVVSGVVKFFSGIPASGITVAAVDRDLRSEQALGTAETDRQGFYEIKYSDEQFSARERASADLVVKALGPNGAVLATSPILFNAPVFSELDLVIPAGVLEPPDLFERIASAVGPLLGDVRIEELEEDSAHDDVTFLSGETQFQKIDIARFILAHRLAQGELPAEFWFVLLGRSFYEFDEEKSLNEQLVDILARLPSLNADAVSKSLTRGFNNREIAETFRESSALWIEEFLRLIAVRTVEGAGGSGFIKSALVDAGVTDAKKQAAFARLYNEKKSFTAEMLEQLERDTSFRKEEIADLRTSFQLAELTRGDFSVVKFVKEQFKVREPRQIRGLAKISADDWVKLIQDKHAAGEINLPVEIKPAGTVKELPQAEVYGRSLERQFREAFPTTSFAGGLERALRNGGTRGIQRGETISRFLDLHESFEFLNTPIDAFLKNGVNPEFREPDESFAGHLKAVQRVFKLAPEFEATDALLADKIHSAQQVYRMGKSQFVKRYAGRPGFTRESAKVTWSKAADTHAAVITIVTDLKANDPEALPQVLKQDTDALSGFPNWNNLFSAGDLCECESCRSVLSPAAYFADLLMFLKDRNAANPAFSVKDILFRRRPDLGYIELNCENAFTTLPYVDTVCEVLEAVVDTDGENDLELAGLNTIPADPVNATAAVKQAFENAFVDPVNAGKSKLALGDSFTLSQVTPSDPDRWAVHGERVTYLLKKKAGPNFFAQILRNTKNTSDELRACPQYINPKAYETLRAAKYPSTLPFDLFAEEVRAAFQKTNLQRWDLMQTLRSAAAPNNPTTAEIAAEYFGISSDPAAAFDEKRLILSAEQTVAGQQAVWGETGATWLDQVANVKKFLEKTRLEYNDLLALLDLKYINPNGDISILHLDPSCDTDKKTIQNLDVQKLDRIHRFLRLWRKLNGWKLWEVDLVIRHPAIGNGNLDEPFLVNLFYFGQLRKRLGSKATIEMTCALFANLNIATRFTAAHKTREDALYQKLFLNRRLINPIDPAFLLDPNTGDLPAGQTITAHQPVLLATLGLRESDLVLFKTLTKASNGANYISDDLTLDNLSFLWRHSWLSRLLKYKADDWKLLLKILHQDVLTFANPEAALNLVQSIDRIKATQFKPDELNWLLSADRTAKAAIKESDAVRFLASMRKALQQIKLEYDPTQYDFLIESPPTNVDSLTALLTSLLQKLDRDETGVDMFLKTLRGRVRLEAGVQSLPAGFAFPIAITSAPNNIPISYDEPRQLIVFDGLLTPDQRTVLLTDPLLAAVNEDAAYINAIEDLNQQSAAAPAKFVSAEIGVALPGGLKLPPDSPSLPIRYNDTTQRLSFIGVMTDAERTALINAPNPSTAIDELFNIPRLAVKFFEPVFITALKVFPASIDFAAQLPSDLAAKISYDAEQRQLRFAGNMTVVEQISLHALAPNVLPEEIAFHKAIDDLAAQPLSILLPDRRVWLTDVDLNVSVPANNTLAKRLANAAQKALSYLSTTVVEDEIGQQCGTQLGLSVSLARYLLTQYQLFPDTLLAHFSGPFASSGGVVEYATLKNAFDGWYWLNRVGAILKKWKITLAELESIRALTTASQLFDFISLPLDATGPIASIEKFLRSSRLIRLRDSLPEENATLLEVLGKLQDGSYDAEAAAHPPVTAQQFFAADVNKLNEEWPTADVEALTSALDLLYPADFLRPETWERMQRVFYFLDNLTTGLGVAQTFAAVAMSNEHAQNCRELLRSKFGEETWLTLCTEIQDVLRERKRDALVAYLLTQPMPADAPSGKWENSNDLYAYYLLDVEMSSCQLTSRLVQASGSIQLFVQRCFMGLEPDVAVIADGDQGDSAWNWWEWLSKYRVWEANRKVFLWPENWIEPELKVDRSSFLKDLENYLTQNEVDQYSAEDSFENYLAQLDGVAQLEIAGFYQQDDADETIIHVFGRTKGTQPHTYYYRTFDYRQWSPWEKVDLEIQGDYLIPAVVNGRLFLFWPIFSEVPDDDANSTVSIPSIKLQSKSTTSVDKAKKRLRMQMAVSQYRKGKWTAKKVSTDFDESATYDIDIITNFYKFLAVDASEVDGRFAIQYEGSALGKDPANVRATFSGTWEIADCKGLPNQHDFPFWMGLVPAIRAEVASTGIRARLLKWAEQVFRDDNPERDFSLQNEWPGNPGNNLQLTPVLFQSPGLFSMSPPWHLSYFDRLMFDGKQAFAQIPLGNRIETPHGTWLPYFYNDQKRTFFVLPVFKESRGREEKQPESAPKYYPEIKKWFRQLEDFFQGQVQTYLDTIDFTAIPAAQKQAFDQFLSIQFPEMPPPPYTAGQEEELFLRFFMRFFHWQLGLLSSQLYQARRFHFLNFYHPFVCDLARLVYNPLKGIPAMMSRETQLKNSGFIFSQTYQPTFAVLDPSTPKYYPQEVMDFTPAGAYSPYNWELFFHAPLFIANSLSRNQQFEEARAWYHYIFNPIGVESAIPGGSAMSKYWITKPFFFTTDPMYLQQRIENISRLLAGDAGAPGFSVELKKALEDQVKDWRTHPFEPHRIANYRTVAYQKTTIMKYLENLIAWGDYLFRQDSMESINEATQLYIMAAEILGPRPRKVPPQVIPPVESFNELEEQFDSFSNALIEVENMIPPSPGDGDNTDPAPLPMLYFCIPQNEKLLGYWDTIADRLYKIRHCMNIEGVVRQLALFEPPIDPAALVKAVAGGVDISSALADLNAPLPLYRFSILLQKANEICNDVKTLGLALLSALEKKDTEALGQLTRGLEIRLMEAVKIVKERAIDEAKENLAGLKKSKEMITVRRDYYQNIEKISSGERLHSEKLESAQLAQQLAQATNIAASIAHGVPSFDLGIAGFGGSPKSGVMFGGPNIGSSMQAQAAAFTFWANVENYHANKAATSATYQRRWDDWKFQESLANKELEQLEKNIAAAELRKAIAEKDLENHGIQIENAKSTDAFMRSKYTNQELYQWHIGQISSVYFQSYKLAYDLAKRAERCFRFELGLESSSFINFGYWDSLKKGLLSGDKLQYDLRRLENAYIEKNRREFELTKQISLALLDPLALVKLRETGRCFFRLPEEIFDLDFPGHYFRRIKSASITLPCVVGPYTSVSCTLRLLKNSIRINTANGDNGYAHNTDDLGLPVDDTRFVENNIAVKAIAASSAQNDNGMFELNFRDERYLPFEGAGAVSEWSLELFSDLPANNPDPSAPDFGNPLRQFDYSTISDAVIHVKYTAREDAGPFKNGAIQNLRAVYAGAVGPTPSFRLFNFRQEFPGQWHQFLNPVNPVNGNVLSFDMSAELFMLKDAGKTLKLNTIWVLARCANGGTYKLTLNPPLAPPPPPGADTMKLAKVNQYGGLHFAQKDISAQPLELEPGAAPLTWSLKMTRPGGGNLQLDATGEMEVKDLMLAVGYQWSD